MTDQRINVQSSFGLSFCQTLEFHLTEALINARVDRFNYFWCDGVREPSIYEQFTSRNITSIGKVITSAWIGPTGQDIYRMTIKLGRCARKRALKGLSLDDCLPDANTIDWVNIDVENAEIELQLK